MKQTVIAVVGPTAVGKTELSVEIAKKYNGEVISGDSMQVYKGMDIGTAKITEKEKQGVPHHLIDIKHPDESFSVAEFQSLVKTHVDTISTRSHLPIIAGGTGLYIQAALYGYNFSTSKRDQSYQQKIEKEIDEKGIETVYQRLLEVDPVQANKTHPNNVRRVIRALEVYDRTGMTMTEHQHQQKKQSEYDSIIIGLDMERDMLYNRINKRVDIMIEKGLIEEVKYFYDLGYEHTQSMKAIGYKEFIPYFKGNQTLEESIVLLKRNSRRYAKRQLTWFKNKMDVDWYTVSEQDKSKKFNIILENLAGKLKKK